MAWLSSAALIAYRDLQRFWRNKFWLAGQVGMNIADLAVFGLIFRGIVRPDLIPDYIRFITPGILSLSAFISAFTIGREVGVELRREVTHYLVSLPVSRSALVMGRILGGAVRGFVYQLPFIVLAALIMSIPTLEKWLLVLFATTALTIAMSSISMVLSTLTRDLNLQAAFRSIAYFTLFFVSNVFYPERVLELRLGSAAPVAYYSPVTMATTIYRYAFGYTTAVNLEFNVLGLLVWVTLLVLLAYKLYLRNLIR